MSEHTPGPWSFKHRKTAESMYATEVFCASGATIATFTWYPMPTTKEGVTGTYREGNARLCAAAPDLLEALKYVRRFVNASEVDIAFINAAIAKATEDHTA